MDAILGDLLASARAGLADLRLERASLVSWLRERVSNEPLVEISIADDAKDVEVSIDKALFGRAIHNVLANAMAHGHPRDVALALGVSSEGGSVVMKVRDRGPGFPEEILPRAFDAFVTGGSSARSPTQGIGLGLALVRRIVEAHGGSASASNVRDGDHVVGAEIEIRLPRA
jgi:signal transduction histidine kinase